MLSELALAVSCDGGASAFHFGMRALASLLSRVRHTPDGPRTVIGDHQRAILGDSHAHRPAPHIALLGNEAHQKIFKLAGRLALLHRHSDDLVADTAGPVP